MLSDLGVEAKVFGSLAQGRFTPHSDIDFLVVSCPRNLKYAIEGRIEDRLGGTPFDVAYLDELPPGKRARFLEEAIDAGDLR